MKQPGKILIRAAAMAGSFALAGWAVVQNPSDALEQAFRNPPDSATPRTWGHWTGGNITKEGITKDLEWMKRAEVSDRSMPPKNKVLSVGSASPGGMWVTNQALPESGLIGSVTVLSRTLR